jgi:signal transduction histidine kinase
MQIVCCGNLLFAQPISRYNTFSYNVNEGLLQSTITDMAIDKNNYCWISFPNGIQKFDGKNFITVPVQPGLPDDKQCYFFKCSNGDLLISHSQGISKYEISSNRLIQVFTFRFGENSPVQFIGEDDNNIIYFYTEKGNITGIECHTFKVFSETKTGFPYYSSSSADRPVFSDNIISHKAAIKISSSLYLWDLKTKKLLYQSAAVPNMSRNLLKLKTENEVLYYNYTTNNALQLYNFASHTNRTLFVKGKDDKQIGRCIILPWQNKILISFNNRLFETDETLQVLKKELVNFQNQPAAGNASIGSIMEDNFGNLFIQTVTNGIRKIIRNNYPVKYYGTEKKQDNFVLSILPDKKNNRILAGTSGNGLLVFDTLQRLIKHIKTLPGKNVSFSPNTILKMSNGNYLLFCGGEKKAWQLSNDLSKLSSIPITTSLPAHKSGIDYFGNFLFQNEREAIIQSQSRLYKTNFAANTVSEHEVTNSYTMSGILYNGMIITHANDELIYLDAATFKEVKKVSFKNTGYVRCFAIDAVNNIHVGSNKGIFIIDSTGKVLKHLNKENGLPDECIYAMVFDDDEFLWCSTNKGILKINKDNSILQLNKEDGLQENEFNTNTVAKAEDGELFFGGVNGVSSFYPSAISSFEDKPVALLTGLRVNNEEYNKDTATWMLQKIILPYSKNSFSFDFVAMGSGNPDQYIYQYKMEGLDKEWIQNSGTQTVRYFLQPGKYSFQLYASRQFDSKAIPLKEIIIIIRPPFWKTWWFLTALALLFVGGAAYATNQFNKAEYRKKLAVLEEEQKIQLERERISRDLHDNIGAYANAVLYNTELLEKEDETAIRNDLMKDLKFASKDIIVALRETIWALKKDNYSAEDCLLRIRNFLQPFTRYYQQIKFTIEGEAPANKELHYTKALNVVRIVQEAVTNAIKHSAPGNIRIASSERDGKWELTVTDNGKGFDYKTANETDQGNGLNNMKQRALDSGFGFTIESDNGTGTKISILI